MKQRVGSSFPRQRPGQREPTPEPTPRSPGTNGVEDKFNLPGALDEQLKQLQSDAALLGRTLPHLAPKVAIVGTARSSREVGMNGHLDWQWCLKLGEELRRREMAVGTGACGGAMEAPLVGYKSVDSRIRSGSVRPEPAAPVVRGLSWEADPHELRTQGGNIHLPCEQAPNPLVDLLATFDRFLFRMEFLFRNTSELIVTPGGFGTLAEVFSFLALKGEGDHADPLVFGAPDDFFERLNRTMEPLLREQERGDLQRLERDPVQLVGSLAAGPRGVGLEEDPRKLIARQRDDLEAGLLALSQLPETVTFVGGEGAASEKSGEVMGWIAESLTRRGVASRTGGSPIIDAAVQEGVRRADPEAEVQGFALGKSPVQEKPGLCYHRVDDFMVLRELLTANSRGLVVAPDGAKALAILFEAATEIQTGEMPKIPIVVVDPDGQFEELLREIAQLMLSEVRQYIDPWDLDIFTVVRSPEEALRVLSEPRGHPQPREGG